MKLAILDRNGSINVLREDFVKNEAEWQPLPGALEGIARLNHAGWHVVIVSNQSGLGRGLFDMDALNAMHAKMHKMLGAVGGRVDAIFFCPHSIDEDCDCRKPRPGLYLQIAERYGVDLKGVPAAGDSLSDLQAAVAAGCEPHLLRSGTQPLPAELPAGTRVHEDLAAFVQHLLAREDGQAADPGDPAAPPLPVH